MTLQVIPQVVTLGNVSVQAYINGQPAGEPIVLTVTCSDAATEDASLDYCICPLGFEEEDVSTHANYTHGVDLIPPATSSSRKCRQCEQGSFKRVAANVGCEPCPLGTYGTDGINCTPCPAGSFSDDERGASFCRLCKVSPQPPHSCRAPHWHFRPPCSAALEAPIHGRCSRR